MSAWVMAFVLSGAFLADAESGLPEGWLGSWSGEMTTVGPTGKRSSVLVVLEVKPLGTKPGVTWKLTYGTGDEKLVKDYKLLPAGDSGRYRLDEGPGSLPARLVDGVLYSHFTAGEAMLTARYELRGKSIHLEVTSAKPGKKVGMVRGYEVSVVQTATLKKE